ncbi:MAG: hypothetical protein ACRDRO_12180, partial [Pseudonocardiaceae bacterium]
TQDQQIRLTPTKPSDPKPRPPPGHQHGRAVAMPFHAITEHLPANSGQLTVHSADGFTATYVVDNSTKISKNRKASDIRQVAANDRVTILATKTGSTTTVTRIGDTGPAR